MLPVTPQINARGEIVKNAAQRTILVYPHTLRRVCLLRSGARYGGSLRCCLGDNLFGLTTRLTGVWTYTVWRPNSDPSQPGILVPGCLSTTNGILHGEFTAHSISPQRPLPAILEGTPIHRKRIYTTNSYLNWHVKRRSLVTVSITLARKVTKNPPGQTTSLTDCESNLVVCYGVISCLWACRTP